ncbi:HNH endonuclease signature motif containing protein [Rhizobium sp. BK376]|uniref:HNH endonuclease n=1 Tax=Rhizobium sp. BK376 TaxID=2512149 RepID=UPI001051F97E|nr:HNH endonuclease signature motif containing protein [Rhizobium sp. BK376]TCR69598.1 hypothetical protein EV561_13924 [Rhizobium sp. BK376]
MSETNRYGLSRDIPSSVKKQVRQACSFGCVVCGQIPYDYDHLRIPFADAREHDPDDIVLLCDACHRRKTAHILSTDMILLAMKHRTAAQSPTRFKLSALKHDFCVSWAGNLIEANKNVILVDGVPILSFAPTDNPLEPILISGSFSDRYGNVVCEIDQNEFLAKSASLGDLTVVSNRFTFRMPDGKIALQYSLSDSILDIKDIFHTKNDAYVYGKNGRLQVGNLFRGAALENCEFYACDIAISVASTVERLDFSNVDMSRFPFGEAVGNVHSKNAVAIRIRGNAAFNVSSTMRYEWA